MSASYTWLEMQLQRDSSSRDNRAEEAEGTSPENQFQLRSYLDLPWNLQVDTAVYYVGSLPATAGSQLHACRRPNRLDAATGMECKSWPARPFGQPPPGILWSQCGPGPIGSPAQHLWQGHVAILTRRSGS